MHMCGGFFSVRVNNRCRAASRNPLNASQTVGSVCDRELNSTDSDHSYVIPVRNTGEQGIFFLLAATFVENVCMQNDKHCSQSVPAFS